MLTIWSPEIKTVYNLLYNIFQEYTTEHLYMWKHTFFFLIARAHIELFLSFNSGISCIEFWYYNLCAQFIIYGHIG